jgi:hypothetical protein
MLRHERVLLLRTGRHLQVAITALHREFPGAHLGVIGTPGSEHLIEQAGVGSQDAFIYRASRFTPFRFLVSRTATAARRWQFTHVAVLWNDPDGSGQGNVDRTALVLSPTGFWAITPDGSVQYRSTCPQVRHECRRAMASVATALLLGALYVPALLLSARRR